MVLNTIVKEQRMYNNNIDNYKQMTNRYIFVAGACDYNSNKNNKLGFFLFVFVQNSLVINKRTYINLIYLLSH